nr:collagen alpha-2(I) chain-like [Equus asinus]
MEKTVSTLDGREVVMMVMLQLPQLPDCELQKDRDLRLTTLCPLPSAASRTDLGVWFFSEPAGPVCNITAATCMHSQGLPRAARTPSWGRDSPAWPAHPPGAGTLQRGPHTLLGQGLSSAARAGPGRSGQASGTGARVASALSDPPPRPARASAPRRTPRRSGQGAALSPPRGLEGVTALSPPGGRGGLTAGARRGSDGGRRAARGALPCAARASRRLRAPPSVPGAIGRGAEQGPAGVCAGPHPRPLEGLRPGPEGTVARRSAAGSGRSLPRPRRRAPAWTRGGRGTAGSRWTETEGWEDARRLQITGPQGSRGSGIWRLRSTLPRRLSAVGVREMLRVDPEGAFLTGPAFPGLVGVAPSQARLNTAT